MHTKECGARRVLESATDYDVDRCRMAVVVAMVRRSLESYRIVFTASKAVGSLVSSAYEFTDIIICLGKQYLDYMIAVCLCTN